jgi:hypothetical protein|tara:strand:+ start:1482 stop:3473 length:1992 start_codon:yes stop_codon:yes gene_type:complete
MSNGALKLLAGAGAKGDPVYVDDLFSTFLYDGNRSTQSITNDIDLSGEGGLVWLKGRDASGGSNHRLYDTERGANKSLVSNTTAAETTHTDQLTSFNSNGFSIGASADINWDAQPYGTKWVSWSFRKQEGFFDVVTYSGTGSTQNVSHNLGSVPGWIIVKRTDTTANWAVYHKGNTAAPATEYLKLNATTATADSNLWWLDTMPTSSVFTVQSDASVNASGGTYVAYLFGDESAFGENLDESVMAIGSYTGDGNNFPSKVIDLGWEPQWLMIKRRDSTGAWLVVDTMRGISSNTGVGTVNDPALALNSSGGDDDKNAGHPFATGFAFSGNSVYNGSGYEYIYVAIRRPMKPASDFAATDLFNTIARSGNNTTTQVPVGFSVDMFLSSTRSTAWYTGVTFDRLRGKSKFVETSNSNAEVANTNQFTSFDQDGITVGADGSGWINNATPTYAYHLLKRAPGFFDVVTFKGAGGSTNTISHSLGSVPEMMWVKRRDDSDVWWVYHKDMTGTPHNAYMILDTDAAVVTGNDAGFGNVAPTATQFTVGSSPAGSDSYNVVYLFSSVSGLSKAGVYTGTGNDLNVDCGFSAGARFVLVKRADGTGGWYLYDSVRGIVAGNDPYLLLDSAAAEVTNTDYIDPLNAGFTVTSSAPDALNASGGTYIFLAIA